MVAHETWRFILVWGAVRANPYSRGADAIEFVCSIIRVVAPSYEKIGMMKVGTRARGPYPPLYRQER